MRNMLPVFVMVIVMTIVNTTLSLTQKSQAFVPSKMTVVHTQMSRILEEETPSDVKQISFERLAGQQACYMRGNGHLAQAMLSATPHQGVMGAAFHRDGTDGMWVSDVKDSTYWTEVYHPNEADAHDQYGMSAEDFRAVVRQCVQSIRDNVKAGLEPHQTLQERRDSWGLLPVEDRG